MTKDAALFNDDVLESLVDHERVGPPSAEDGEKVDIRLNEVSKPATKRTSASGSVQRPVKRKRGRPRKVTNETETTPASGNSADAQELPKASVDELAPTQAGGAMMPEQSGELQPVSGPQPMTLSLSPPPMPSGKLPQPAGVLLLPLYSSTPTDPGEQPLVVVQPHQLANLPFAVGGQAFATGNAGASALPMLTTSQPIDNPLVHNQAVPYAVSEPALYTLPSVYSSHTEPSTK